MNSLLRNCGLAALIVSAAGVSVTTAEAGGRRNCCCQSNYYAPATTTYAAPAPATASTTDGHQRYQSAYQAPEYAPVYDNSYYQAPPNNFLYGSAHYGYGIPLNFQQRSFHDQWDAGRKIRGY